MADQIPTYSADPTIQKGLAALYGQSGDVNAKNADGTPLTDAQKAAAQSVYDQRQSLFNQNAAYQANQNVQNLYGLNQANANTFLADASAGLAPLTTGQNPNTQTYTPDAGKTMNAFEQVLMGNKANANTLFGEFAGSGANPLLGQYTTLPSAAGTQGTIIPKAPTTSTTPAANAGAPTITGTTTVALTGTPASTGTSTAYRLLAGQTIPTGMPFDQSKVVMNGQSYIDNDGYTHYQVAGGGEYVVNRAGIVNYYSPPRSTAVTPTPTPTPTPASTVHDITSADLANMLPGQKIPTNAYFDPKQVTATGTPTTIGNTKLIPTATGTYAVDATTGVVTSFTSTVKPNTHAKGGSVQMPQEYSQGNWKLI